MSKMLSALPVLTAAIIIQMCLGGIYAWSVIVGKLQGDFAISAAQGQVIFGVMIAVFTLVMVPAGRFFERYGPRRITTIGGVLFALGYFIAAVSQGEYWLMLLGIGLFTGAGIGCAYVCPLATAVRWFPQHRGLIAGLTVAGMGIGAILLSNLAQLAFRLQLPLLSGFSWLGLIYGAIIIFGGQLLRFPAVAENLADASENEAQSITHDRRFFAMLIGMFCGTFAGLLVVGNLKMMGISWSVTEGAAIFAVSLFSIGNAAGRIIWGMLADRFGSFPSIVAMLLLASVALLLLPFASGNELLFLTIIIFVALSFGGCFVLFAAHVDMVYGDKALPQVYPLIFLTYGAAALAGPAAGGWLYQHIGNYLAAVYLASAVAGAGAILFFFVHGIRIKEKLT